MRIGRAVACPESGAGRAQAGPGAFATVADSRIDELRRRLEREPGSRLFAQLAEEHRKAGNHAEAIRVARAGLVAPPVVPVGAADARTGAARLGRLAAGRGSSWRRRFATRRTTSWRAASWGRRSRRSGSWDRRSSSSQKTLQDGAGRPTAGEPDRRAADQAARGPHAGAGPPCRAARAGRAHGAPPPHGGSGATRGHGGGAARADDPHPHAWGPAVAGAVERRAAAAARRRERGRTTLGSRAASGPAAAPLPTAPASPLPRPRRPHRPQPHRDSSCPPPRPRWSRDRPRHRSSPSPSTSRTSRRRSRRPTSRPPRPSRRAAAARSAAGARAADETVFEEATRPEEATTPPLASSTLAELYFRQGLADRAVEVYRQVLAEEPGNDGRASALAQIEAGGQASPQDPREARRRALERTIAGPRGAARSP